MVTTCWLEAVRGLGRGPILPRPPHGAEGRCWAVLPSLSPRRCLLSSPWSLPCTGSPQTLPAACEVLTRTEVGGPQGCDELGAKARRGEQMAESAWQAMRAQTWRGSLLGKKPEGGHCQRRNQREQRRGGELSTMGGVGRWEMRLEGQEGQVPDQGIWTGSLCPVVSNTLSPLHTHIPIHTHTHTHNILFKVRLLRS